MPNSKGFRIDLHNLSKKDIDIMSLTMDNIMKKYKMTKSSVYTRKKSLNKRLQAEGLTMEQILNDGNKQQEMKKSTESDDGERRHYLNLEPYT